MAAKGKANAETGKNTAKSRPRSFEIAQRGIRTGRDFANMMSALMSDLIEGKITPGTGNAVCNEGGKLLKVVELQAKYGQAGPGVGEKVLQHAGPSAETVIASATAAQ